MNKNQKAIFCTFCLNWIHRKCNGTSNKEYDLLVLEDDSTPWQCILCNIEEMAAKFPFTHSTNMELNDLCGLDFPSLLQLLHLMSLDRSFLICQLLMILILMKLMYNRLAESVLASLNFLNFGLPRMSVFLCSM